MRDADDSDDGGRIPPRRSMGGSGTSLKGVSQFDFNEFMKATNKRRGALKTWLGWMTVFTVVLVIALFISARMVWYQANEIHALTQMVDAHKDLLGTKADVATVTALIAEKTAPLDTLKQQVAGLRTAVGSINPQLASLVERVESEQYATKADFTTFRDSMRSELLLFEGRVAAVLPSIMPRVEERLTERLAQFRSEQSAARDALRASVDQRIEGMKWQNRLAVGLGAINTAVWGIHIAPDTHHK